MDIKNETWVVIDSYFKNTQNYIEKHHIDSYNDFIDVKLKQIFRQVYKQNVYKSGIPENHYLYTAHVYLEVAKKVINITLVNLLFMITNSKK